MLAALSATAAACPAPLATVPVHVRDGYAFVPAAIAGHPATLLLDTGSGGMAVTPEAVRALPLPLLPGSVQVLGTGGASQAPVARLDRVQVGGLPLPDGPAPVLPLPGLPAMQPPVAGLLGAPLLHAYDVELDLPAHRMALHRPGTCGALPVRLHVTPEGERLVPVLVNGQPLLALLDTGVRGTMLTERAAQRLGLRAPVAASTARGVDGTRMELRYTAVRTLQVGTDVARGMPVMVAALQAGGADVLLGLDWVARQRVTVSYAAGALGVGPR